MKLLLLILVLQIFVIANANACYVEVNGRPHHPQILKQGEVALANQDPDQSIVLITCGPFNGQISGAKSVTRLAPGTCTLVFNNGDQKLFECQK